MLICLIKPQTQRERELLIKYGVAALLREAALKDGGRERGDFKE